MELSQKVKIFGHQSFLLLEDKVVVRFSNLTGATEFSIKYSDLNENPTRLRRIAIGLFVFAGVLLCLSIVFIVAALCVPHNSRDDSQFLFFFFAVIFGILGFLIGIGAWKRTFDSVIFASRQMRIALRHNKPDPESFRQFLRAFQEKITNHSNIEKLTAGYLLRWLHAEGFLDEWKFKEAKARLQIPDEPGNA